MSEFLRLEKLYSGYDDVSIINGISLSVERGSVTALVGSNGAGKTTLMRTLSGLLPLAPALQPARQPLQYWQQ